MSVLSFPNLPFCAQHSCLLSLWNSLFPWPLCLSYSWFSLLIFDPFLWPLLYVPLKCKSFLRLYCQPTCYLKTLSQDKFIYSHRFDVLIFWNCILRHRSVCPSNDIFLLQPPQSCLTYTSKSTCSYDLIPPIQLFLNSLFLNWWKLNPLIPRLKPLSHP